MNGLTRDESAESAVSGDHFSGANLFLVPCSLFSYSMSMQPHLGLINIQYSTVQYPVCPYRGLIVMKQRVMLT